MASKKCFLLLKLCFFLNIFVFSECKPTNNIGKTDFGRINKVVKTEKKKQTLSLKSIQTQESEEENIEYSIFAFGKDFRLNFRKNNELLAQDLEVKFREEKENHAF